MKRTVKSLGQINDGRSFLSSCMTLSQLCLLGLAMGCAQPAVNTAAAINAQPMPVNRAADNYEWIKRLQVTDPVENAPQVATPGSQVSFPIPVPLSAGAQYALVVNRQYGMAWLQSSNGTTGPWSLEQPDVTHLLKSVTPPPPSTAASAK